MPSIKSETTIYFQHDGVPGDYFECASYGSMSVAACARNFTEAPLTMKQGRLQRCVGCELGRQHAGGAEPVTPPASTSIIYRVACARCRRDGRTEGTRLLGRLRLVRRQTICVSCYNREREVLIGANAKGARPKKWNRLFNTRASFVAGARAVVVEHPDPVVDRIELALTMFRQGHKRVAWAPPSIQRAEA
jgi:hypothetical protein